MSLGPIASHFVSGSAYAALVLASNPDAYWRHDDTSGAVLADSSGNGHHGAYSGTITYGISGCLTGGGDLNAASQVTNLFGSSNIQVPAGAWMDRSTFTITTWYKSTDGAGANYIYTRWNAGSSASQIWGIDFASGGLYRGYARIAGATRMITASDTGLRDGNWHMAALTYDGSSLRLFSDGALVASMSISGTLNTNAGMGIRIGHRFSEPNGEQLSGGKDETTFGPAVSDATIAAWYAAA